MEGDDDKRLVDTILKPRVEQTYDLVEVVKYAQLKPEHLTNYLRSINGMGAEYLFFRDFNQGHCITERKTAILNKFSMLAPDKIVIVVKEIEAWYLAGLDSIGAKKLKVKVPLRTDDITKEDFNNLMPKQFLNRTDFMVEILQRFSITTAESKNSSFRYFLARQNLS